MQHMVLMTMIAMHTDDRSRDFRLAILAQFLVFVIGVIHTTIDLYVRLTFGWHF